MRFTLLCVVCVVLGVAYMAPGAEAQRKPCQTVCTANYDPVCGFDGREYRTFSNSCQLSVTNCTKNRSFRQVKKGQC